MPGYTFLPNPLNGNACENNGTMIIDVTDPKNPVEKALIPAPAGGQAQMARMCLGSQLPGGTPGKVYLMRNVQGNDAAQSGYQVWDVTDSQHPSLTSALTGIRSTHKQWWECNTGIAYMPGSKNAAPLWLPVAVDAGLRLEATPMRRRSYIRTFGLPGAQPDRTGATPASLHGAISAHEHPEARQALARGERRERRHRQPYLRGVGRR